jgi:hypothetical protein
VTMKELDMPTVQSWPSLYLYRSCVEWIAGTGTRPRKNVNTMIMGRSTSTAAIRIVKTAANQRLWRVIATPAVGSQHNDVKSEMQINCCFAKSLRTRCHSD